MDSCSTRLVSVKEEVAYEGVREAEGGKAGGGRENLSSFDTFGIPIVELSSDSENENESNKRKWRSTDENGSAQKKCRGENNNNNNDGGVVILPAGFLDPLPPMPPEDHTQHQRNLYSKNSVSMGQPVENGQQNLSDRNPQLYMAQQPQIKSSCKQFWKAGDYEGKSSTPTHHRAGGIDHVRVHPRFLHSNATSHKWALGAFAELLDNSLDEACNGATFVKIDMVLNQKDGSPMLFIEDDGGGMDPDKMRSCMSLGYSAKSKIANMIGQYGNGFKTSTMRLGADVIVFSKCREREGKSGTQSIGLLSYTFLRSTGQEDIVVPMVDYEIQGRRPRKLIRFTAEDWSRNLETIKQWSPFFSEAELIQQFNGMKEQGTRIILYNIWENDQGELELDFDTDIHDIQVRGANRDEKIIKMAQSLPNSSHYLTYKYSLRSYASILYLRLPAGFRIILRGKYVEHHNLVNDLMYTREITYKPQGGSDINHKENNLIVVTIGFLKNAKDHLDIQGFNVYHKNRLIKPFWRIWNPAGSDGRGVMGVLEANFIEPAHDKQGFERTTVLARLESRLIHMQKQYWLNNCEKIGYAPRQGRKSEKDSYAVTKETGATDMPIHSSTSKVKPIPLAKDPVPAVMQVENTVHENQQSDHNTVQAERHSASCRALPEVANLPHEEAHHLHSAMPSPQRLCKSSQKSQDLQKRSRQSKMSIVGQQESPQRCSNSPELHAAGNQQMDMVPFIPSEPSEQVQVMEQSQNSHKRFLQSSKHIAGQQKSPQKHLDSPELHVKENQQMQEAHSVPSEPLEQLQVTEQPQAVEKQSLESRKNIVGQQKLCVDFSELHATESRQLHWVQPIPLEPLEEVQVTSHAGRVLYSLACEPSHGSASSLSAPTSTPPNDVDSDQLNRGLDFIMSIPQISQVSMRTAVDGIGLSSTTANAIACAEPISSSNLRSHIVNLEFGTNSIHGSNTDSGNFHIVNANRRRKLEDENTQLKKRLKVLEETALQSLQTEIEKNRNLEAHIVELEKKLDTSEKSLSAERLQRELEENEFQNKLKNAQLRIQELEQRIKGFD